MIIKHYFSPSEYIVYVGSDSAKWVQADALKFIADCWREGRHMVYTRNDTFQQWEIKELE